jgi:hypothetical protein
MVIKRAAKHSKSGAHDVTASATSEEQQMAPASKPGGGGGGGGLTVLGLRPSPEIAAISLVYFVQGILGLSRLALSFFLKDDLRLEPASVAFLSGLAGLPWMIKPLYVGPRRRSLLSSPSSAAAGRLGAARQLPLAGHGHAAGRAASRLHLPLPLHPPKTPPPPHTHTIPLHPRRRAS